MVSSQSVRFSGCKPGRWHGRAILKENGRIYLTKGITLWTSHRRTRGRDRRPESGYVD
ncbi:protein of unknown function [Nitrospira japonica]|uniref:Uncharacterized protein n=1 Tax=Nitrospira japonica TaxID=1325564 RepID=A0A1W1I8Z4_9BACT|nr:protein of unknown function [Nitrospira japonica]